MQVKRLIVLFVAILVITGCTSAKETVETVAKDVEDMIQSELTKDDQRVLAVKNGHFEAYPDRTVGEAFDAFFATPTWKYFEAEAGEDVVEFTGYFTYYEQKAKARIQFLVHDEGFEVAAVAFNDLPQNTLNYMALIAAVYENNIDSIQFDGVEVASTDEDLINKVKLSVLDSMRSYNIQDIFNDQLFSKSEWSVSNGVVSFQGYYNGEIFPGEPSHLTFVFQPDAQGYYYTPTIKYNGTEVSEEGFFFIIDLLEMAMGYGGYGTYEEFSVGPWDAIRIVEEQLGLQYADAFNYQTGQYETEPEPIQIFGTFCWIIPVIDPNTARYVGELYVDWDTGDIYDEYGNIIGSGN